MSRENVELVRRAIALFATGGHAELMAMADPGIVIDTTRNVFNPATYSGPDGVRTWLAGTGDVWDELRFEDLEFVDGGECVGVIGRMVGRGRGSGVPVERPNGQLWRFQDGRVVRIELGFTSRDEVLEAAGLS